MVMLQSLLDFHQMILAVGYCGQIHKRHEVMKSSVLTSIEIIHSYSMLPLIVNEIEINTSNKPLL